MSAKAHAPAYSDKAVRCRPRTFRKNFHAVSKLMLCRVLLGMLSVSSTASVKQVKNVHLCYPLCVPYVLRYFIDGLISPDS